MRGESLVLLEYGRERGWKGQAACFAPNETGWARSRGVGVRQDTVSADASYTYVRWSFFGRPTIRYRDSYVLHRAIAGGSLDDAILSEQNVTAQCVDYDE